MSNVSKLHPAPVVVTGGAGFLGCNIADALASRGEEVVIFDNLSRPRVRENLQWLAARHPRLLQTKIADIRDADAIKETVAGARAVIHLAAQVAVTTSVADPVTDFEINARGTLNVLEAVRNHAPDAAVLFASTNKVYGKRVPDGGLSLEGQRYAPQIGQSGFDESTPLDFYSPYGCSKGVADQYVLDYARIYGMRSAVFRMSCLYGPRQFGTEDQGWVAHFLMAAIAREKITIYGDGYQVRDALFVDDAVDAYLRALDNIDAVKGRAFNLGGGLERSLSLRELLARIEAMTGATPDAAFADWRPGDQPWYVSDTAQFSKATGWRAQTSLDDGLLRLFQWLEPASKRALP